MSDFFDGRYAPATFFWKNEARLKLIEAELAQVKIDSTSLVTSFSCSKVCAR